LVIELGSGIEEAEDAGVNEVIEIDVDGEVLVNANSDRFDERQVFQNDGVAPFVIDGLTGSGGGGHRTFLGHSIETLAVLNWRGHILLRASGGPLLGRER